jgi:CRISPR-associated protein Csx14
MPEICVQLDPCNPGQFYACCGLIELFELAGAKTLSQFHTDYRRPRDAEFRVQSDEDLNLDAVIRAIKEATFVSGSTDRPPYKDSIAPVSVSLFDHHVELDWWLSDFHEKAGPLKCWAGQVTTQKLTSELPKLLPVSGISFDSDGFTSTRFGVDPRSAWEALGLGYSPNEQNHAVRTFPVVEVVAAIGLQGFRPVGTRKTGFRYCLWLESVPAIVARTVCMQPWDGLPSAMYAFRLEERGSYKYFSFAERADLARE